ncbi:hypothetical protein AX16_006053 [Volvariella volvacea WC 439]|nr:hypothetical protein AX16_006053 [Volvariella volvacea WC 439]
MSTEVIVPSQPAAVSSQEAPHTSPRRGANPNRGRGGGRGGNNNRNRNQRNRGQRGGHAGQTDGPSDDPNVSTGAAATVAVAPPEDDTPICWICAEPVKYWSVPECNHRTCHVCALRLRALYKKTDCTFCKEPQPTVIFTSSADALFASFMPDAIPYKDAKLSIFFETQELMEETLILLRFNCPDSECDYIGNGWGDLKLHVRATHGKLMCDLCIRMKKVFAHEHALYQHKDLLVHLPSMYRGHQHRRQVPKEQVEGGIHPLCEFCRECFFGDDELYAHMRERHEECFVCKRNGIRDQYFQNYESLERHFNSDHHPCTHPTCLARKFVVFNTSLDLQGHMVEEHGGEMSSRDKRNAARVQAEFDFDDGGRRAGPIARRDRERERERERDRDPPPQQNQAQQMMTRPGGNARRREFGAALSGGDAGSSQQPQQAQQTQQQQQQQSEPIWRQAAQPAAEVDPAVAERHAAFISRLAGFAANPNTAIPVVKAAIRSYRAGESTAKDLILTIWNTLDRNLEYTASVINAFVDLLGFVGESGSTDNQQVQEDERRKTEVLGEWKGFAVEQRRQFPELVPTTSGSGYAGITSGRVINAKHATASKRNASQSSRQVWDRVAAAASSSGAGVSPSGLPVPGSAAYYRASSSSVGASGSGSGAIGTVSGTAPTTMRVQPPSVGSTTAFPPLSTVPGASAPVQKQVGQRLTPWSASAAGRTPGGISSASQFPEPRSVNVSSRPAVGGKQQKPPKLSESAFPELPSSGPSKSKTVPKSGNVSLKNILGNNAPAVSAWGSGSGNANANETQPEADAAEGEGGAVSAGAGAGEQGGQGGGGKKKGKGKQKQTLFTLGAFPS